MKVKDLIEKLSKFNPNADITILDDKQRIPQIKNFSFSWNSGGDSSEETRNIEKEKQTTNRVSLYIGEGER